MRAMYVPQFHAGGAAIGAATRFGHADLAAAASVTNQAGLSGWGFTASGVTITEGGAGDFLSSADIAPTFISIPAAVLVRDVVVGGYSDFLIAKKLLSETPTRLVLEVLAAFPGGFTNAHIGISTNTVAVAQVSHGSGVWTFETTGGNTQVGTPDTGWHLFKFVVEATNTYFYVDGVLLATRATSTDRWPQFIEFGSAVGGGVTRVAWYDCRWEA